MKQTRLLHLLIAIAREIVRGRSQTTFTRRGRQVGRQVVQKCPLFVNVHTIENVNTGGQVVKTSLNLVNIVCERPLIGTVVNSCFYKKFGFVRRNPIECCRRFSLAPFQRKGRRNQKYISVRGGGNLLFNSCPL